MNTTEITAAPPGRSIGRRRIRESFAEQLFKAGTYTFILVFTLLCVIPFWVMFINSFATEGSITRNGFQLLPDEMSVYSYQFLFRNTRIIGNYGVSLFVTIVGTLLAVLLTAMFSYAISNKKMKYRNVLSFLTYFTMLFGAGLVGFYIMIANWLHLKDSIFALILPYLFNPFFAFILVSFYRTIPYELNEAAIVDGSNDAHTFFVIILPVAKPAIATITLFFALQYWNDFYLALLFIDDYKLYPLQMMIRMLISNLNAQQFIQGSNTDYNIQVPTYGLQLATVCVTIGPIILLYPFVQKYFVKGMTVGAVKG